MKQKKGFGGTAVFVLALLALITGKYIFLLPLAVVYFVPLLIFLFVLFLIGKVIKLVKQDKKSSSAFEYTIEEAPDEEIIQEAEEKAQAQEAYEEKPPEPKNELCDMKKSINYFSELAESVASQPLKEDIREICAISFKLVSAAEADGSKKRGVLKFLNYYLPVLYKIVSKYAQLDEANLTSSQSAEIKDKIVKSVDKTKDAFQTKLNTLYEVEILDIDSDISVLETMLARDGLTVNGAFDSVIYPDKKKKAEVNEQKSKSMELIMSEADSTADALNKMLEKSR